MTPTLPTYDAAVRYVSELAHLKLDASYHHRLEMGTALALDPDMMQVDAHGQYRVLSSDRTTWYRVNGTCDCDAARYHHEPEYLCKHRAAVGIAKKPAYCSLSRPRMQLRHLARSLEPQRPTTRPRGILR